MTHFFFREKKSVKNLCSTNPPKMTFPQTIVGLIQLYTWKTPAQHMPTKMIWTSSRLDTSRLWAQRVTGILTDFIWRVFPKLSKFEFITSICSSPVGSIFPQRHLAEINWNFGSKLFFCFCFKYYYSFYLHLLILVIKKMLLESLNIPLRDVLTQLLFLYLNFAFFFTILNMNMYPIITNINNSP